MTETWIIPCNTRFFDVESYYRHHNEVVWKNYFTIKPGDTVYIYVGGAIRQIKYRCRVVNACIDDVTLKEHTYAVMPKKSNNFFSRREKYMLMEFEYEYPNGALLYEDLKKHGLGQVQLQARADRRVVQYIENVNEQLIGMQKVGEF